MLLKNEEPQVQVYWSDGSGTSTRGHKIESSGLRDDCQEQELI